MMTVAAFFASHIGDDDPFVTIYYGEEIISARRLGQLPIMDIAEFLDHICTFSMASAEGECFVTLTIKDERLSEVLEQ